MIYASKAKLWLLIWQIIIQNIRYNHDQLMEEVFVLGRHSVWSNIWIDILIICECYCHFGVRGILYSRVSDYEMLKMLHFQAHLDRHQYLEFRT